MNNDRPHFEEDFSSPCLYDDLEKAIDALPYFQAELNQIFVDANTILMENNALQKIGIGNAAIALTTIIEDQCWTQQNYLQTKFYGSPIIKLDPRTIFKLHQQNIPVQWDGLDQPLKNTECMAIGCIHSIHEFVIGHPDDEWGIDEIQLINKVLIFGEWLYFTKNYRQEVRVATKQKIKKKSSASALKGKGRIKKIHKIIEQFYENHKDSFPSTQKVAEYADELNIAKLPNEENKFKLKLETVVKSMRKYKKSLAQN